MPLKEPSVVPPIGDLIEFLSSSIAFMACIQEVDIYLNDTNLAKVSKVAGPPTPMPIPPGISNSTTRKFMTFLGVDIIREFAWYYFGCWRC
jgi:Protein of unknown function (DUF3684)